MQSASTAATLSRCVAELLTYMRIDNPEQLRRTLAAVNADDDISADRVFEIAEFSYPPANFEEVTRFARALGFRCSISFGASQETFDIASRMGFGEGELHPPATFGYPKVLP